LLPGKFPVAVVLVIEIEKIEDAQEDEDD